MVTLSPSLPAVRETGILHRPYRDADRFALPALTRPTVSVVIPAMNEAENLRYVLTRMPRGLHEVVLVDGDSVDGTIDVAMALSPGVKVVRQTAPGKGNALTTGFRACTGDIIVTMDADGSADPAEIPAFVSALLAGADFAKGSRFLHGGGSSDITRLRSAGNSVLNRIVNTWYGTRYTDLCYGYNAFWARHVDVLDIDCPGFEVETLMLIRAAKAGLEIREVASFESTRIHGASNLHAVRDGLRVVRTIWSEHYAKHRRLIRRKQTDWHAAWDGVERRQGAERRLAVGAMSAGALHALDRRMSLGRRAQDRTILPATWSECLGDFS